MRTCLKMSSIGKLTCLFFFLALTKCQHSSTEKKKAVLEFSQINEHFKSLSSRDQKNALQNSWTFFSAVFQFDEFQDDLLKAFPSLNVFGQVPVVIGNTPLDMRALQIKQANPVAILLAIDLEIRELSRFHNQNADFECLELFWRNNNLPTPSHSFSNSNRSANASSSSNNLGLQSVDVADHPLPPAIPRDENINQLALLLRQSLKLPPNSELKPLVRQSSSQVQFKIPSGEIFEIFAVPLTCPAFKEKKYLLPAAGTLRCLQKQSSTWMTVLASESTVLDDKWVPEARQRCERWNKPLSTKSGEFATALKNSVLPAAWSLYPRLQIFIEQQADRYERAFQVAN